MQRKRRDFARIAAVVAALAGAPRSAQALEGLERIKAELATVRANPAQGHEAAEYLAIELHRESKAFLTPTEAFVEPLVKQALAGNDGPWQVPGVLLGLGGWAEARADFETAEKLYVKGLRAAQAQPGAKAAEGLKNPVAAARCALDFRLRILLLARGRAAEAARAPGPPESDNDCSNLCENLGIGLQARTLPGELGQPLAATAKVVRKGAQAFVAIKVTNVSKAPVALDVDKANGGGWLPCGDVSAEYFPELRVRSPGLWKKKTLTLKPRQSLDGVWIIPATPMRGGPHRLDLRVDVALPGKTDRVAIPIATSVQGAGKR